MKELPENKFSCLRSERIYTKGQGRGSGPLAVEFLTSTTGPNDMMTSLWPPRGSMGFPGPHRQRVLLVTS